MRLGARSLIRWCADIMMMAAALALTIQGTFIAQAATGVNGHYHHGYGQQQAVHQHAKTHVVAHVHADGTVHQHAVDDGKRALKDHSQQPGCPCCWNMAIVIGVLPSLGVCTVEEILIGKLAIEELDPYRGTEPDGPRRPPRPPSIA